MGGGVDKPDDRSLLNEGQKTLSAQSQLMPQQYDLYSTWAPQYAQVGGQSYVNALQSLYSGMGAQVNDANTQYRQGILSDMGAYGQSALNAVKGINPTQQALTDTMSAQALADLQNNGQLSNRDKYDASQIARSAGAARGNLMGNSTIFNEYLNNENLIRDRRNEARNFAGGMANMENSLYSSPAYSILTANSAVPELGANAAMQSAYGITPSMFDPFQNAYASDLYNTNYNAQYNAYLNSQNNLFGAVGGLMNMGGSIGGAMAGG